VPWRMLTLAGFAALAIAVTVVIVIELQRGVYWRMAWVLSPIFAVIFVGLLRGDSLFRRALSSRPALLCGQVSYSLYLIHMLAFHLVGAALPEDWRNPATAVAALLVMVPLFYLLCERPFVRLSKRISVGGSYRAARRAAALAR